MKKKRNKFKLTYHLPTSRRWRKIGDSMLASCLLALPFIQSDTKFTRVVIIILIAAKFITSFINEASDDYNIKG